MRYELNKKACTDCLACLYCTKGNYGELYLKDNSMESNFPTCCDIKLLIKYILENHDETLSFYKLIFAK